MSVKRLTQKLTLTLHVNSVRFENRRGHIFHQLPDFLAETGTDIADGMVLTAFGYLDTSIAMTISRNLSILNLAS